MTERPTEGAPSAGMPAEGAPGAPGPADHGPSEDRPVPEGSFDMDATAVDSGDEDINTEAVNDEPGTAAPSSGDGAAGGLDEEPHPDTALAAERLADLQRLQAEFVNYKRRVERDRDLIRENATYAALAPIVEVLDTVDRAREHGDLDPGFQAVADQLERTVAGLGLTAGGALILALGPFLFDTLFEGKYRGGLAVLPWTLMYCVWTGLTTVSATYIWCAERARLVSAGYEFAPLNWR